MKNLKNNKLNVALLGLGLDNQALLSLLVSYKSEVQITICDERPKKELPKIKLQNLKVKYQLGILAHKNLELFDIIFRSPGWPLSDPALKKAVAGGTEISSPLNLFFILCPTKNIIGVTGSKGKGTTATLIAKILQAAGHKVWLGGNIGISPLSFVTKIKVTDYVVLELSSFQLEDLHYSPRWAVITNLFSEHLAPADPHNPNFHSSLNSYWQAKINIATESDNQYLIVNKNLKSKISGSKLNKKPEYFSASALPSHLIGDFNRDNIGAAVTLAKVLKIPASKYKKTIAAFKNLEHRLEFVIEKNGIKYFDNSFATTPESSLADIQSFTGPIIQIAGGADKGADFTALARIIKKKIKHLILLPGRGSERLKKELQKLKFSSIKMSEVENMAQALTIARSQATKGDTVLLSTACASFGIFKNYKERGDLFKKYARLGK
ncbi:UDP-N-acetylmuramoyl-L-alanine--D-glutamate ligase [Candidatus Falkowbacteria bacterium]|uniref:UDP-N-acetylmuramoylalanine--D-glutamate ligase n=1 Tax=Candidatus Falkowbacteria bacterium CG10_big_fil_rev_8_21_14_0_10_37_18 TaxID=1974562 RepID=A0A2H0V8C5_9BACT|nr:UDP-N-acetylmuramoyl-L-alanine--D-glutamate ligase [Candidatus Falkowbacteria bacterium]NCQ12988.1 UDP-N-acetylmuramoyl-L-alanine--D-glutamate ligase [Candidatus Falkowbacteria bacterium]PIR95356.1 MAG: UDP-N-acetylmuramoyl-L-alanine--D-glutamate ligase [Candidatus Falkowbacteria bacterium CG10_big_fil_rev_8_21_14_0_10_37_18]